MGIHSSYFIYDCFVKDILCDVKSISKSRFIMPLFQLCFSNYFYYSLLFRFVFLSSPIYPASFAHIAYIWIFCAYGYIEPLYRLMASVLIMFVFIFRGDKEYSLPCREGVS